jgi:hypothetical protein
MFNPDWGLAQVEEFIPARESVVVTVRLASGSTSALTSGKEAAWVADARDGLISRLTFYRSKPEALYAVENFT